MQQIQGELFETQFVMLFNSNKTSFNDYLSNYETIDNVWLVRITTKQISQLNNKKVYTRADCFLAKFAVDITDILKKNNYYLSEDVLINNNISYEKLNYSGISVKMHNSKHFQIIKLTPHSFYKLFGNYELGAGASLFCSKESVFKKNLNIIDGWHTTLNSMYNYFSNISDIDKNFYMNQENCKEIKYQSNLIIQSTILKNKNLRQQIFNGINLYEEPYTAHYFYNGTKIEPLTYIPFYVSTGSGRTRGDYTIVLKPK